MENLGTIIKGKREEKSMSQTELATRIGRSPQLLCDIEAGRKRPSIDTLVLIAKELALSLDEIFLKGRYSLSVKGRRVG